MSKPKNVLIGNDVWIGHRVTITGGVNIADGAVTGANSHIVKNVNAYTIVGGKPAQKIKDRFDREVINDFSNYNGGITIQVR